MPYSQRRQQDPLKSMPPWINIVLIPIELPLKSMIVQIINFVSNDKLKNP